MVIFDVSLAMRSAILKQHCHKADFAT